MTYLHIGPKDKPWISLYGWTATLVVCVIILSPCIFTHCCRHRVSDDVAILDIVAKYDE